MPKSFLNDRDRSSHRLANWVQGEKRIRKITDTELANEYGISQSAMSRKLRLEQFSFNDYVFFVQKFRPDTETLRFINGI